MENLTGFVAMVNLGALWSDFNNTLQSFSWSFSCFLLLHSADRHVSGLTTDGLHFLDQCVTHCMCVYMYVAMTLRMQRVGGCSMLTPQYQYHTTCHLYLNLCTKDLNKMALLHKSSYSVFFQVFPEILPQMQPELPKECREPTRHAALSGRTTSFLLTLPNYSDKIAILAIYVNGEAAFALFIAWISNNIKTVINNITIIIILMIN